MGSIIPCIQQTAQVCLNFWMKLNSRHLQKIITLSVVEAPRKQHILNAPSPAKKDDFFSAVSVLLHEQKLEVSDYILSHGFLPDPIHHQVRWKIHPKTQLNLNGRQTKNSPSFMSGMKKQCCEVRSTHFTGGWSTQHLFKIKKEPRAENLVQSVLFFGRKLEVGDIDLWVIQNWVDQISSWNVKKPLRLLNL